MLAQPSATFSMAGAPTNPARKFAPNQIVSKFSGGARNAKNCSPEMKTPANAAGSRMTRAPMASVP